MQSDFLNPEGGSFIQRPEGARYLAGLVLSHGLERAPSPDDLRDSRLAANLSELEPDPAAHE